MIPSLVGRRRGLDISTPIAMPEIRAALRMGAVASAATGRTA